MPMARLCAHIASTPLPQLRQDRKGEWPLAFAKARRKKLLPLKAAPPPRPAGIGTFADADPASDQMEG
jgi:hypothetical protein